MLDLSPLDHVHRRLGARMGEFSGWQMPIQYRGVVEEHTAVRERVGLFDVSHLGKILVRGAGAGRFLNRCLTNDVDRVSPGGAQYTLCCAADGGVLDDLFLYLRSDEHALLVPNAANAATVARLLTAGAPPGVSVADAHREYGILAVQGPSADEVLAAAGLPQGHAYLSFVEADWNAARILVCRTGYTGERGYEIVTEWDQTPALWEALLRAGDALGILPCGLGARDTLRTEMGYPLHGQDISPSITPVQARLSWAVGWTKPEFFGRTALLAERATGPSRVLRGVLMLERSIPRPGMTVRTSRGEAAGEVTSGTFSPTLRQGIGLALLDAGVEQGDVVLVDVRGRQARAEVVRPPFVTPSTR